MATEVWKNGNDLWIVELFGVKFENLAVKFGVKLLLEWEFSSSCDAACQG